MAVADRPVSQSGSAATRWLRWVLVVLSLWAPACAQTPTPTVENLWFSVLTDANIAPTIEQLTKAYHREYPNVTIELAQVTNAEQALQALQAGSADLIAVSWLPDDTESEGRLWVYSWARDAIVIITHSSNPVGELTLQQLRDLFGGQVLSWSELGGMPVDIIPVSREAGAGTRDGFESLVMGRHETTPTAVVMPSNEAVVEFVATTPGAIGYVSSAWLAPAVNLLAIEGVTPSPESVKDGRYLLSKLYYLAARVEPVDGPADFLSWIRQGEGRAIVEQAYGSVP
jgi:phosphate transport system substrate-binding protein